MRAIEGVMQPPVGYGGDRAPARASAAAQGNFQRIRSNGKFFQHGSDKWYLKGLTYGPFAPNDHGEFLPPRHSVSRDFAQIGSFEANCIRLYHPPPIWLLDEAALAGLHVFVDVPWQKHRCFFEDWDARREALDRVRTTARTLGNHPATFAISVANEIPADIVRFYGASRIERFIGELIDAAKQEAPQCLATYSNYPSTEYLTPRGLDFLCFNVYLEEQAKLCPYLDRLQHIAGPLPLVLGEFGLDAIRHGERAQADLLTAHVGAVFRHGLAGSFVFSYTDDWFTGGHRIENWAFGITDRERNPKPAATALQQIWTRVPKVNGPPLPKVSVVVCSYNGDATLEECLRSLQSLDYPSYEVILVDDGSTDTTPQIAKRFPWVRYIHQENRGLSFARNVGAQAATGSIVAYTDSDCVADANWLHYLISAMIDQQVDAIGGPNVPPPSDGWIAQCVAASPGGPSHVMLDDRFAEHIPGCNMAFDRRKLLDLGGFDAQFRIAGDDVDICWRFLDDGMTIGYAPAALVWHHRRSTVGAYLRQQKGYGRSEAMVYFKHPARFNAAGQARWNGVIYGDGAVGLPLAPQKTWHGRFGSGLFQVIYRHNQYSLWSWPTLLEWHIAAAVLLALAPTFKPLAVLSAGMWILSLVAAARSAVRAPLPKAAPRWCRPLVMMLHLLQPIVRSWHRYKLRVSCGGIPAVATTDLPLQQVKRVAGGWRDMYWRSIEGRGRHQLLEALVAAAKSVKWPGDFQAQWEAWDLMLLGGPWHKIQIRTASEELGGAKFFTRVRWRLRMTRPARIILAVLSLLVIAMALDNHLRIMLVPLGVLSLFSAALLQSRRNCSRSVSALVWQAGADAGLEPVGVRESAPAAEPARVVPSAARTVPAEAFGG